MRFLQHYIRLLFFWMLFFFIQRLLFLFFYLEDKTEINQVLLGQLKALPMDLSASCYIVSLALAAGICGFFIQRSEQINRIVQVYSKVMIVICILITAADMGIYKVWGTKLTAKAISYMAYPKEVLPTLFSIQNSLLFLVIAMEIPVFVWLFKRFYIPYKVPSFSLAERVVSAVLLILFFIIGVRGGLQKIPINRNWVFFSSNASVNFATLNGFWNFADLLTRPTAPGNNPYSYFSREESERIFQEMHRADKDSTLSILNTKHPNIVLIMLESWAADVVECLGGEHGVTPKFCELAKDGMLFTRFYSTGFRTEQGMLAIMSCYPAQPVSSIIQEFGKFDKLPNIYREFDALGYHTSYYTGGRLQFDNIESYLHAGGVQKMVGEDDFTINKRTFWGAYDDEIYAKQIQDLKTEQEPFFSTLSTLVTHEWFDANVPKVFTHDADPVNDSYRNTMHYADSCLYAYLQVAKNESWYQNTLFVLVADHSCRFPKGRTHYDPERHHIPMMLFGGALKQEFKGTKTDVIGSHTDIAATLLAQMRAPAYSFPRSKNLLSGSGPRFAYYAFDNGFGMISANNELVFDHNQMKTVIEKNPADTNIARLLKYGKAYLQVNFQENMDYAEIARR